MDPKLRNVLLLAALGVGALAVPELALAGTGGTEFSGIYTTLTDWMTGLLGRTIAASFVIVGLVAGVIRQSIYGFVVGVAAGLGMFLAPGVIDSVVTATVALG